MKNRFSRRRFLGTAASGALVGATGARSAGAEIPAPVRSLFDGATLNGWHTSPRLYVPRNGELDDVPANELKDAVLDFYHHSSDQKARERAANHGVWRVEEGAVVGGQVPGSTDGSYLVSDETFGDFDLTLEARPDWPIDTGIMVRAHPLGTVGYQVLLDHRPEGCMGGAYGNGIGNFKAFPYLVSGQEMEDFRVDKLRQSTIDKGQFVPDGSASFEEFASVWKLNDWNKIRIRCRGELPVIETWINGLKIMKLDTARLGEHCDTWEPELVKERLGSEGHIALEVHDSPRSRDRWAPGAVCRWRNVNIRTL